MPLRNIEDVKSPRHGRHYLVEAVRVKKVRMGAGVAIPPGSIIPIMGPKHTDVDIGFEWEHYHIDWRFLYDRFFNHAVSWTNDKPDRWPWRLVIQTKFIVGHLGRLPFAYKRHLRFDPIFKYKVLEEKYKDAKMTRGVCPHRGIACEVSTARDGVIVCPGHGLTWSLLDGSMVPRERVRF